MNKLTCSSGCHYVSWELWGEKCLGVSTNSVLICSKQQESEMNGVPSLTLPSISEDDENVPEEGETSPLSPPNRSPLHASSSPRHAKFRYPRSARFNPNGIVYLAILPNVCIMKPVLR